MKMAQLTIKKQKEEIRELRSQLSYYISNSLFEPEVSREIEKPDFSPLRTSVGKLKQTFLLESAKFMQALSRLTRQYPNTSYNAQEELICDLQEQVAFQDTIISSQKSEINELKARLIKEQNCNFSQVIRLQSLERAVSQRELSSCSKLRIQNELNDVLNQLQAENQSLKESNLELSQKLSQSRKADWNASESSARVKLLQKMHEESESQKIEQLYQIERDKFNLEIQLNSQQSNNNKDGGNNNQISNATLQKQIEQYREIIDCLREEIAILKKKLGLLPK